MLNKIGDFTSTQNIYENYYLGNLTRGVFGTPNIETISKAYFIVRDVLSTLQFENNYTIIGAGVTADASFIEVGNPELFNSNGGYALIENELIKYNSILNNTLRDCIRGYLYTTAVEHNNNLGPINIYHIEKPFDCYVQTHGTTCSVWTGNMPLSCLSEQGVLLLESGELMIYKSTNNTFTNKILNCNRNVVINDTFNINNNERRYPPESLIEAGTTAIASKTVSDFSYGYGTGVYQIQSSSYNSSGYYFPSIAFDKYDVSHLTSSGPINQGDTIIYVSPGYTTYYPPSGKIKIDNEIMTYTSKTSQTLEGVQSIISHPQSKVELIRENNNGWQSNGGYNIGNGNYTGATSTTVDAIVYNGEWLQILLPAKIKPSHILINTSSAGALNVVLAGSNDETSWNLIKASTTLATGDNYIIPISNNNVYKYFRCIVQSVVPGSTYASINQMAIYANKLAYEIDKDSQPITNEAQLIDIRTTSLKLGGKYYLANDIDVYSQYWYAIGTLDVSINGFSGLLDGNGFKITIYSEFVSFQHNSDYCKAVFGLNTGMIQNLSINTSPSIDGGDGTSFSIIYKNDGYITNCNITNIVYPIPNINHQNPNIVYLGLYSGFIFNNYGFVANCKLNLTISSSFNFVINCSAFVNSNNGQITDSEAIVNITNPVIAYSGYFSGFVFINNNGIYGCKSIVNIYRISQINASGFCQNNNKNITGCSSVLTISDVDQCSISGFTLTNNSSDNNSGCYNSSSELTITNLDNSFSGTPLNISGFANTSSKKIQFCKSIVDITGISSSNSFVSGFVGNLYYYGPNGFAPYEEPSTIINCSSSGQIICGDCHIGGFIGTTDGLIEQCSASVDIVSTNINPSTISLNIGGFIAQFTGQQNYSQYPIIKDCWSGGTIDTSGKTTGNYGGFIGYLPQYTSHPYAFILRCFSVCNIFESRGYGFGGNIIVSSSIENSYWNITYNQNGWGGGTTMLSLVGLTTEEMKIQSNFTTFNFTSVWDISTSYPFLRLTLEPAPEFPPYKFPKFIPMFLLDSSVNPVIINGTLNTNVNISDTIITIINSNNVSIPLNNGYMILGSELVKINSVTSYNGYYVCDVRRGFSTIKVSSYIAGLSVYLLLNNPTFTPIQLFVNNTTSTQTEIEYDLGTASGKEISTGFFLIIGNYDTTEFITVSSSNSLVGYNNNTHSPSEQHIFSKQSTILGTIYDIPNEFISSIQNINTSGSLASNVQYPYYYYLAGNSININDDCDISVNSKLKISITGANYTGNNTLSNIILIIPQLYPPIPGIPPINTIRLNENGGYVLLSNFNGNTLTKSLLAKYNYIYYDNNDGNYKFHTTTIIQPTTTMGNISFNSIIYLRISDTILDPYNSELLQVGTNGLSNLSNIRKLIPLNSTIIGVSANAEPAVVYKTLNSVKHTNVNRFLRNNFVSEQANKLYRVDNDSGQIGFLAKQISSNFTEIPLKTVDDFGSSGILLVDTEFVGFLGNKKMKVLQRGSFNTFATTHQSGNEYYQYVLNPINTNLNYNINSTQNNISVNPFNFTSSFKRYIIASSQSLIKKNPEILSGVNSSSLSSLNNLIRAGYGTTAKNFNLSTLNINVYPLNTITNSKLRTSMSNSSLYAPVINGSVFPLNSNNNKNYLLIDNEFMKLINRSSLDTLSRNQYGTLTATVSNIAYEIASINAYSKLRGDITINHIFIPLQNGSSYTSSGDVLIDNEWITYNNKNTFDVGNISYRGQFGTIRNNIEYYQNLPVLITSLANINGYKILRNDLTSSSYVISLSAENTQYNEPLSNGLVLIDNEFISIGSKKTFDITNPNPLTYRGHYVSITNGTITTNIMNVNSASGYTISKLNSAVAHSVLRSNITADYKYMPLLDGSSYGVSGIGLIDNEFFSWVNKNTLDGLTRGEDGTTAITQDINTGVNIVSRTQDFPQDINGNYILNSITINGDKVLLSDCVSGIRISDNANMDNFPKSGTISINGEQILYNSKYTLADITRGTNQTISANHLSGSRIYLIDTQINNSLINKTLTLTLFNSSLEIELNNVDNLPLAGLVIINSELISYLGKQGTKLINCSRGRYNTQVLTHNINSKVYLVPLINFNNILNTKLNQYMNEDDLITSVSENSNFSNVGTILIGSEIMTYQSTKALGNLIRGVNSTNNNISAYPDNSSVSLVSISLNDSDSTVLVDSSISNLIIDLPAANIVKGRIYTIKKIAPNNEVIINPYQLETIDGNPIFTLFNINSFIEIQSDGVEWKIITNSTTVVQENVYKQINLITQQGTQTSPVTINSYVGVIKTVALTMNLLSTINFIVYNSYVSTGDVIFTQITTNTDDTPYISVKNIINGQFTLVLRNITGSQSLIAQDIAFQVVKKI